MAKRKRKNKKSPDKYKPTAIEKLLCKLEEIVKKIGDDSKDAQSLLSWYLVRHEWTPKQAQYAKVIIDRNKEPNSTEIKKYSLYAISNGESVKLGFSSNIPKRIKTLQTSQSANLKVIWKYYVGNNRNIAVSAEKKIHRLCKKHRIRGEWFKLNCMDLVNEFSLKTK